VKGVSADVQGHASLRIGVTGSAQGQAGDQIIIAAFFYDPQNAPVLSQLPQTPYSSKDGKLSVAAALTLNSVRQPFDLTLDLPLASFPPNLTGGVQFHCVAFYGDQRIGETGSYTPVSAELLVPPSAVPTNPGAPAPDTGNGAPAAPSPRRPGSFGTRPIRPE
jgi:hypothetical protein